MKKTNQQKALENKPTSLPKNEKFSLRNASKNFLNVFGHTDKKTTKTIGALPLGMNYRSKYISTQELLTTTYFVRSVQMIANDIASLDCSHLILKKNKWVPNNNSEINYLLNMKPNSELSAFEFKKILIWNIFLYGYAAILITRKKIKIKNKTEEIIESFIPIYSNYIEREIINGVPKYKINITSSTDNLEATSQDKFFSIKEEYSEDEIIWLSYELLDNFRNTEFKNFFAKSLSKVIDSDNAMQNSVMHDVGIQMLIKVKGKLNEEMKTQITQALLDTTRRMKETGQAAFIQDGSWEVVNQDLFKPSKITDEIRKNIGVEFAATFGIPPALLGIDAANSYGQQAQITKSYSDKALKPLLTNIMQKFSFSIFEDSTINKISYSSLGMAGLDAKEKIEFLSKAINAGIMTQNEARENVGLSPIMEDSADLILTNSALQPTELIYQNLLEDIENKIATKEKLNAETEQIKKNYNSINQQKKIKK